MGLLSFRPAFVNNIVAQAEFRHQRYVINSSRSGRIWIALALLLLIPALIGSVVYFVSGLISPFISIHILPEDMNNNLAFWVFLLMIVMNVALYAVVQLITVGLGASSILREKQGRTWETLLLTNIDARQIVWGKWWATIRALGGDQLMVAWLRYGLVAWAVQRFTPVLPPLPLGISSQPVHIALLALIVTVYTLIDAAFSSALGIFSPLPDWSGAITGALILSARVAATAMGVVWLVGMFTVFAAYPGWTYLLVAGGGLAGFALSIWVVLRLAQMIAVRGQASPPEPTR